METETMGQRIRRLRKARDLTQPELAKLCGVTKSAVSQWEDDTTQPAKLPVLAKLLDALHVDLRYLVWGENRAPAGSPAGARRRSALGS